MKSVLRELEAKVAQAQGARECLDALLALAEHHAGGFRNREALRSAREALNIARARREPIAIGRALAVATLCHFQRGDYVSAVATGLDAVDAYAEGDLAGRSSALRSIALALHAAEAHPLAESAAHRAVDDALAAGDAAREAQARGVWGLVLAERGRSDHARRQFRTAGALHRALGDKERLQRCATHLGHTYRRQGIAAERSAGTAQARLLWRHATRIYRIALLASASPAEDALALAAIAECEWRLGHAAAACEAARRAIELAEAVGSAAILASCHLWHSHALQALGDAGAARAACRRAVKAAEDLEHDPILFDCLKAEAKLLDAEGRFEAAQDLEMRSNRLAIEREALLGRLREEIAMLWERRAAPACLPPAGAAPPRDAHREVA